MNFHRSDLSCCPTRLVQILNTVPNPGAPREVWYIHEKWRRLVVPAIHTYRGRKGAIYAFKVKLPDGSVR